MIHTPVLTKINKRILIVLTSFFVINSILSGIMQFSLVEYLGLSAAGIMKGHIFQLITYPLVQRGLIEFVFNALILWFIGADLELRWGQKTYCLFLLFSVLGAGVFYLLISFGFFRDSFVFSFPLVGISGMNYALLIAYGMIFSERILTFMLLFPMKAKYFCLLLVGIELYMAIFSPHAKSAWAHLAAIVSGIGYLKFISSPGWSFSSWRREREKKAFKKKLTLLKPDSTSENDPKFWQ